MARQSGVTNPFRAKKITAVEFDITDPSNVTPTFNFKLQLKEKKYDKEHEIKLFFEKGNFTESFHLGTVESHDVRGSRPITLPQGVNPTIRLVIVNPKTKIFSATSAKVRFTEEDSETQTLLPTRGLDLGEQLWRLDIDSTGPMLVFNNRPELNMKSMLKSNWAVKGSVLPAALRLILIEMRNDEWSGQRWVDDWGRWLKENDLATEHSDYGVSTVWNFDELDQIIAQYTRSIGKFSTGLARQNNKEQN